MSNGASDKLRRALNDGFSKEITDLLQGYPWGTTFPNRPKQPTPANDGRTVALKILKLYLSEIICYKTPDPKAPPCKPDELPENAFQIPAEQIHVEWPDNEEDLLFPAIGILSGGLGNYEALGLNGYIQEETANVFKPNTVVQWQSEYTENIVLDVWASSKDERRAIISALEVGFSPTETQYGIRFKMPDYYNQLVCFSLSTKEIFDDEQAAKGRRRARLTLEMYFTTVTLVNIIPVTPLVKTNVDVDEDNEQPVDLDADSCDDECPC